tara:strand:- start:1908 stop:2135 length:228 start_codon:yes stop_codon:yes gene_type:complete
VNISFKNLGLPHPVWIVVNMRFKLAQAALSPILMMAGVLQIGMPHLRDPSCLLALVGLYDIPVVNALPGDYYKKI